MLYLLPYYYWEYYCGGTLAGYLAHLKNLITAIKTKCETVADSGMYGGKHIKTASIFDENSTTFATSRTYEKFWVADHFQRQRKPRQPRKEVSVPVDTASAASQQLLITNTDGQSTNDIPMSPQQGYGIHFLVFFVYI